MNKIYLILGITVVLSGCAAGPLHDQVELDQQHKKDKVVDFIDNQHTSEAVVFLDTPPPTVRIEEIDTSPAWHKATADIQVGGLAFYKVVDLIVQEHGLVVHFAPDVDINMPIFLNFNGKAIDALNAIASSSNYSFSTHGHSMSWRSYETKRYSISHIGGKYEYQIGSSAGEDSGGGDGELSSSNNEFQKTSGRSSLLEEIKATLESITGDDESAKVIMSESASSVTVIARRSALNVVDAYMKDVNDDLSLQVELAVQVIKFQSNQSASAGVDWNLIRDTTSTTLSFDGATISSDSSNSVANVFGLTQNTGAYAASNVLLSALSEQGTVTIVTEPTIITQVNRVAELHLGEKETYISQTTTTVDSEGNTTTSIEPSTVSSGYKLYVYTNVDDNDRIYLQLSSSSTDLLGIDRKVVGENAIESPKIKENKFAQTLILRDGQTLIANRLISSVESSLSSSPINAALAPLYKKGADSTEETIVLITPRIRR